MSRNLVRSEDNDNAAFSVWILLSLSLSKAFFFSGEVFEQSRMTAAGAGDQEGNSVRTGGASGAGSWPLSQLCWKRGLQNCNGFLYCKVRFISSCITKICRLCTMSQLTILQPYLKNWYQGHFFFHFSLFGTSVRLTKIHFFWNASTLRGPQCNF